MTVCGVYRFSFIGQQGLAGRSTCKGIPSGASQGQGCSTHILLGAAALRLQGGLEQLLTGWLP